MIPAPTNREALGLVAGFGLWSLTFLLLYGGHGLACGLGARPEDGAALTRILLLAVWIAMLAAHGALIVWFVRRLRAASDTLRFVRRASVVLAVAALVATFWTGLPVAALEICDGQSVGLPDPG
ncbi:hypothetical protein [Altericroceibacterium xinjiangense]|uniref:hypothetical protein n=1 Tax=Altericroceibacterium xinjiangense TaxID=762261 RepID=UPI000F7DB70F|nr:hypothetical protein [Altericroceibacterium xinjiangense]